MTAFQDNLSPYISFVEHVDPTNPAAGNQRLFVDTDHILKMVDSSGTVTTFGGGFSDPMTTRGDVIYRNASNVTARLPIGSSGKVLSSDGTDVSWQTPSGGSGVTLEYVQSKFASSNTATTLTMDATPTNGNILVFGAVCNGTADITSITQTNITYTKIKSQVTALGTTFVNVWVAKVAASAGTGLTIVRPGGNAMWGVAEFAYSGTITPAAGTTAGAAFFASYPPLNLPATTAGHLIVCMAGDVNQNAASMLFPSTPGKGIYFGNVGIVCCLSPGTIVTLGSIDRNNAAQNGGTIICEVT